MEQKHGLDVPFAGHWWAVETQHKCKQILTVSLTTKWTNMNEICDVTTVANQNAQRDCCWQQFDHNFEKNFSSCCIMTLALLLLTHVQLMDKAG